MEDKKGSGLIGAVVVSAAVVAAMWLLSGAIVRSRSDADTVRVTGSARKAIESDFIIWNADLTQRAPTVPEAYAGLKKALDRTTTFLTGKGISAEEIVPSSIRTQKLYAPRQANEGYSDESTMRPVVAYELSQTIEVRSSKVDLVDKVAREVTDLISQGVSLDSSAPRYIYTKISDVKVEILSEAAKDARRRAEEIAKSSGATLTGVRSARMSPLQITPIYSTDISGEGINDTSSRQKAVTAIVTMGFGVR